MSERSRARYFVTNHQSQPLELHLASGALMVGAYAEAEIRKDDLQSAQLEVLRRNRLLTIRKTVEVTAGAPAAEAEAPEDTTTAGTRRTKSKKEG